MRKRVSPSVLARYDVTQKIIEEFADLESRTILFCLKTRPKLVEEISHETNIPLSTVYKKLHDLEGLSLVYVEKRDFSERGRRQKSYRSRISQAKIRIAKKTPELILIANKKGKH